MGWFLTKKTNKKKKKRKGSGQSWAPADWDPQRTLTALKVVGVFALGVSAVVGWRMGENALRDYAASRDPRPVHTEDVSLTNAPGWMSPLVREELRATVAAAVDDNKMNGDALRHASGVLGDNPWVRTVRQVRRLGDGSVTVEAEYRRPIAIVEARDGYLPIDARGVRLPGVYLSHQVPQVDLPVIVGVRHSAPAPGARWQSDALDAGLATIDLIGRETFANQVRAYAIEPDARGRARVSLVTADGQVVWGYPPGREEMIEPHPEVKLARLRELNTRYRTIDAGRPVVEIYGAAVQGWPSDRASRNDYTSMQ